MVNYKWDNPKPPLKQEGSFYNQYWFTIKTKEYDFYPKSSEGANCEFNESNKVKPSTVTNYGFNRCCPDECMNFSGTSYKLNTRYVAITVPKNIDFSKKHKWLLNLDFNLQGYTSDWACSDNFFYPQLKGLPGGMIENPYVEPNGNLCEKDGIKTSPPSNKCTDDAIRCFDAKEQGIENFFKYLEMFLKNDVIIVHTSQIYNDLYYNRDCESQNPCSQCWYKDNPDEQYLKVLFDMIYNNNYTDLSHADDNYNMNISDTANPRKIEDLKNLKLDYENMAILGYSVGAGAVSRYINEFPLLKTNNGISFPKIKLGIMLGGGSYLCYSLDCKNDPKCSVSERTKSGIGGESFNPCVNPNICTRGCCPTNISEINYYKKRFDWKDHPPIILMQSINDYLADRNASLYYYNVMKKNNVPCLRLTANTNVHGLASVKSQINPSIPFLNKYFGTTIPIPNSPPSNSPPSNFPPSNSEKKSKNEFLLSYIVSLIISGIILIYYIWQIINKKIKLKLNYLIFIPLLSITVLIINILLLVNNFKEKFSNQRDNYFEKLYNNVIEIKNEIFEKNPVINGVFVHLFSTEDLDEIINQKDFKFNLNTKGITDCSIFNPKTCSAWTYLRKDLPPILYNFPSSPAVYGGYWTPNWGVVVDANKFWPLVTTMGITDSDTFGRNQLNIDINSSIILWDNINNSGYFNNGSRCSGNNINTPFFTKDNLENLIPINKNDVDIVIQSFHNNRVNDKNTSCGYNDDINSLNCRYTNAGAGQESSSWLYGNSILYGWDCPYYDYSNNYGVTGSVYRPQGELNGKFNKTKGCFYIEIVDAKDLSDNDINRVSYELQLTLEQLKNKRFGIWKPTEECWASKYPFVCISKDNPITNDNTAYPNEWIKENGDGKWGNNFSSNLDGQMLYVQDGNVTNASITGFNGSPTGRLNLYTGSKSDKYSNMFWNFNNSTSTLNPVSSDNIMTFQCKFEKKDMYNWIFNIKKYWKYIYSTFNGNNKNNPTYGNNFSNPMCGLNSKCEDSTYWNYQGCIDDTTQANWTTIKNGQCYLPQYLYGHPSAGNLYYENEVNVYVDPKQSENSEQNKIFRDSIIGFIVIPKTCEDYMKIFKTGTCLPNNKKCNIHYTYGKPYSTEENYTQRCSGYQCSQKLSDPNDKTARKNKCDNNVNFKTYGDVHDEEKRRISIAESKCKILLNLFNDKYRKNLYKAKLYHCFPSSNTLQDYEMLKNLFNDNINWNDIFKEI